MGELDVNVGKLKKNAFRYSKVRGETASRIRIPGGVINASSMAKIVEIAEQYGNGVIDITNRQGIEIPGIRLEDVDKVNEAVQSLIDDLHINQ
ncbi:MAG: sulfite reductase subunit C, partial [Lachnospiraceae bacterium]